MASRPELQEEVDKNYQAFQKLLPTIIGQHSGKFALMRHEQPVNYFDSPRDAKIFAEAQFADGLYSIQRVEERILDLGYFSHAVPLGQFPTSNRPTDTGPSI